jgi:hypothetical protein
VKKIVYDISLLIGVLLIGGGVALLSIQIALMTVGALVIVLTVIGAWLTKR